MSAAPVKSKKEGKKKEKQENGTEKSEGKSSKRPALLNMKLSETETSDDEAKYRYSQGYMLGLYQILNWAYTKYRIFFFEKKRYTYI